MRACVRGLPHLKLNLQGVDLGDAHVPLLVDEVQLRLLDPPLALGVAETVRDLLVLAALGDDIPTADG